MSKQVQPFKKEALFMAMTSSVAVHIIGLRFSNLDVSAAAGRLHQVDMQPFLDVGCVERQGGLEISKSPVGEKAFCQEYAEQIALKQSAVAAAVGKLKDPQVA